jgi:quercetin dioxygenase-like cupin family protein
LTTKEGSRDGNVPDQLLQDTKNAKLLWEKENAIMNIRSISGAACLAVAITAAMPVVALADGDVVTPNFEQAIPNIPGKSLIAVVVDYPPGGSSLPHMHAKSAFIFAYVLAGEIESQVNDGPKRIYRAGGSFYEMPGSNHPSRNASKTESAKLLAVFVVDANDKPLTTPVK